MLVLVPALVLVLVAKGILAGLGPPGRGAVGHLQSADGGRSVGRRIVGCEHWSGMTGNDGREEENRALKRGRAVEPYAEHSAVEAAEVVVEGGMAGW